MKANLAKAAIFAAGLGLATSALAQDMRIVVVSLSITEEVPRQDGGLDRLSPP